VTSAPPRLVLVEGLGGAGKTTTAGWLAAEWACRGMSTRCIRERDRVPPRFRFPAEGPGYAAEMLDQWRRFAALVEGEDVAVVTEGHGWQPMAEFLYLAGGDAGQALAFCAELAEIVAPLRPALVYLEPGDVAAHLARLERLRPGWLVAMEARDTAAHGLARWGGSLLRFWRDWSRVQGEAFSRWPHAKLRVADPQEDWAAARGAILDFVGVDSRAAEGISPP
jgi:hypothetical protein